MPSKPSMENPINVIAFVILVTFFEAFSSFPTCNSQFQGMTVPPPALSFFAHFYAE